MGLRIFDGLPMLHLYLILSYLVLPIPWLPVDIKKGTPIHPFHAKIHGSTFHLEAIIAYM